MLYNELRNNVYQVKIPLKGNPLRELNAYVIKGDDKDVIIDTGFNSKDCGDILLEVLEALKVDISKAEVVITHLHSDHSGLAYLLEERGAKLYASKVDGELINNMVDEEYWDIFKNYEEQFGLSVDNISFKNHPGYKFSPSKKCNFNFVGEGDVIKVGEYELEVVETPGHTPGQIGLYERKHKFYFSADHILGKITPNIAYWGEKRNDLKIYEESLDKISKYDVDIVYTAHRGIVEDMYGRIKELRQHHVDRLNEIYAVVTKEGITARDVASQIKWSLSCKTWNDFPDPQKWFATSEAMSHLEYLYYDGRINKKTIDNVFYYSKK